MDVNKMHVEKIIFDIRTTQSKVEGYIIKGRNNKEMDYGFKQPKLEPGIGKVTVLSTDNLNEAYWWWIILIINF